MIDELIQRLKLAHQPVGIWFEDEAPARVDLEPSATPRCVVCSSPQRAKSYILMSNIVSAQAVRSVSDSATHSINATPRRPICSPMAPNRPDTPPMITCRRS